MVITIIVAIFVAVATFTTFYDSLDKLSTEFGQDVSVAAPILAAAVITAIATCAMIWNWWFIGPILIIAFGVLEKIQFSWWGYASLAMLLVVSWVSAQMEWGSIGASILGRFILTPIAALLFVALANWSRKEDKEATLLEKIEELKERKV